MNCWAEAAETMLRIRASAAAERRRNLIGVCSFHQQVPFLEPVLAQSRAEELGLDPLDQVVEGEVGPLLGVGICLGLFEFPFQHDLTVVAPDDIEMQVEREEG